MQDGEKDCQKILEEKRVADSSNKTAETDQKRGDQNGDVKVSFLKLKLLINHNLPLSNYHKSTRFLNGMTFYLRLWYFDGKNVLGIIFNQTSYKLKFDALK